MNCQDNKNICNAAWNLLRIETDGNCYSCSSAYVKDCYSFGNIFENEIDEIWNGKAAQEFRRDKIEETYKYCKYPDCHLFASNGSLYNIKPQSCDSASTCVDLLPCVVSFSWDYTCSECCVFCRDEIQVISKDEVNKWESILHTKLIPILKNAKILEITCCGEFIKSLHSQKILKEVVKVYPELKLRLFTNGIDFSKEKILELGILNNLYEVCVSIHSANSKTYKKIFKKDNYDKVIKNVLFLSELKNKRQLKYFNLQFVINKYNYRDIKKFIKFTSEIGAYPIFSFVSDTTNTKFTKNPYNWAVFKPDHYLYNDFVSVINDEYVQQYMPDFLKRLNKISKIQIIKNYWAYWVYLFQNRSKKNG